MGYRPRSCSPGCRHRHAPASGSLALLPWACLASLDLVEYNPMLDVRSQTAELLLDLLQSLFGKSTLSRPRKAT